ncbi:MAG TPA: nitroreductase family protein [Rectinemataceae bacterium]|nr:nitroreductase family protein [Rectinemataceae bacterium]
MEASSNPTLELLLARRSIRDYEDRPVPDDVKDHVIAATMRAPTAGNMMLYQVIEVEDADRREYLSHSCDEQPFIAKAPWLLVFVADYQRWYDYFRWSGAVADRATTSGSHGPGTHPDAASLAPAQPSATQPSATPLSATPAEGDLMLAVSDALIAAQTAAIAAEALGLGSCYIGDIMENYEKLRDFFALPSWAFPVAMLAIGWPTGRQLVREQPPRFDRKFIVAKERYRPVDPSEYGELFGPDPTRGAPLLPGAANHGQHVWKRKFANAFMDELRRSVRAAMEIWRGRPEGS